MKLVKVVLFLDGRPGHEKQSRGIVHALERYLALETHEVVVSDKNKLQRLIEYIGYFLYLSSSPGLSVRPDLIIGTGSRTHIPALLYKRSWGGRAITCMSPPLLIRSRFDLCFIPFHDNIPASKNVVQTIGPPNLAHSSNLHDHHKSLILVGGEDSSSHLWDTNKLLQNIIQLLDSSGDQRWTISGSPRTPTGTDEVLENLSASRSNVHYVPFSQTESGWIEKQYESHKTVWVTEDSVSMVYEALSAGCRVGVLPVEWKRQANKFRNGLHSLVDAKRIITLDQFLLGNSFLDDTEPLDEADKCAREIAKKWWPKELQ